ncbi:MAG: ABC transporter substrate-binding protein, partial [Caldilineaceae bacterium]|nr:ABC transporter substrate-binding protein [Caldilineaceae bacterium]
MSGRLLVKVIFTTIGLVGLLALFGGCAVERTSQAAAAPVVTVEVTRVVLRELVVPATPTPPTACSPEQLAQAEELVIGALLPLSNSPQWPSALGMQTGLNAAAEMLASGVGGLPVRLVTYDPGDDPARAAQMAEMLITEDCALGLIVGLNEEASGAVRLVSERFRKPMLV